MLPRMQCPSCNEEIDDGVAICPHCDAVVDPSAFDDSPRPSKPAAPKRPATKSGVKPVAKKPLSGAKKSVARPKRPAPKPEAAEPLAKAGNAAGDWRSKVDPEDWNQMPASQREPAQFQADKGIDPDDFIGGIRLFVDSLSAGDKLAFFGAVATLLSCFFPWKETVADGDVLGLGGPGLVTFLMGCLTLVVLTLRVNKTLKVNELLLWAAQLGTLSLGVLWALVSITQSWDPTLARSMEGNQEVWVSKPSFGVILAVLSGGLTGFGTVLGLKGEN
jgi:hypothetical protein